jgi:beta-lactamase regulating signal transducer with metallopeptidase domain
MNPLISLLITLTCEVALVVGVGFVAERLLHSVRDRRRLWCAVLIGVGLLAAVELAGLRVEVRRWANLGSFGTPRSSDPRWVVTEVTGAVRPMVIEPPYSVQEASTPTDLAAASRWTLLLSALWLLGTIAIWVRSGYQRRQLQRVVRQSHRVEVSAAREIARRLGLVPERIQLCEAAGFLGPVAFGVFSPTVLLPCRFVHRYGDLELKVLLAHELAHLAACDPLWLAISDFLSGLLWWHPAVWWSRRRLRATSEIAADEASCLIPGGRLALAEALVAFGNQLAGETSPAGFGVGGLKSDLATRVTRLLAAPVRASSRLMTRVTVAGTFCALLAIGMAPWPGKGAQPVVTAALESIGSLASKPPRATKVIVEAKSESSQSASHVPGFDPGPSDSNRQPPSPRESLQLGETNLAVGGNPDSAKEGSTPRTGLGEILVPTFQITEGPLQDSVQRLQQILRDADSHKRDLRITVATKDLRIRQQILQTGPVPADSLLQEIANSCTIPVEWTFHGNEIVFDKIASGEWPLTMRWYQVGPAKLLSHIRGRLEKAGGIVTDGNIQNETRTFLAENGVIIPKAFHSPGSTDPVPPKGAKALFLTKDGASLFVVASVPDHIQIHRALAVLQSTSGTMPTTRAQVSTDAVDAAPRKQ